MSHLISVIVPVYNVEKYLAKCIESITQQSYHNLEIILVNDGSQDSCPDICEYYRSKDKRIKVIHQENRGLSAARNRGLEIATGSLLSFIDSDDYIHPHMLKILKEAMNKTNADITMCNYQEVYADQRPAHCESSKPAYCTYDNIEALKHFFGKDHFLMVVVWNKLYKRHLYESVRFPEGMFHEDTFTTYKVLFKATKISFVNIKLHYYLKRADSITGRPYSPNRLVFFNACREILEFMQENNQSELYRKSVMWYFKNIIRQYNRFSTNGQYPDAIVLLMNMYRTEYKRIKVYRHIPIKKRIPLIIFSFSPPLYLKGVTLKRKLLYRK